MNKEKLIERYKNGYRKTQVSKSIGVKTFKDMSLRNSEENSKMILTLKIVTDSDSPIYKDWFGDTYKEQIASTAFDESLAEVKEGKRIVYSFEDHKVGSENVVSSTQRETTKLFKDENNDYIMEFELDPNNEIHKRYIELIKNKELNANSFIFLPQEIEILENTEWEDVDYKVIQKKGELLSIDAVIFPFYPQNEIELKGVQMAKPKKDVEIKATEVKEEEKVVEKEIETTQEEPTEDELKAIEDESKVEEKTEEEVESQEETSEESSDETETDEIIEEAEVELEKSKGFKALSLKEQRKLFMQISKREITLKDAIANLNKTKPEVQEQRDNIAKILTKNKGEDMTEKEKLEKREALLDKWAKRGAAAFRTSSNFNEVKEDIKLALSERNSNVLDTFEITEDELNLFGLTRSGLTGADNSTGAQIIPVSTDPNVVGQSVISAPEFSGATRMAMSGLEEKKIPIDVDTFSSATEKAEGEAATEDTSTVVKVQFEPKRFPISFDYNPLLASHARIVQQKTTNQLNKITNSWLDTYYGTLLTHKAVTLDSLITGAGYTGGVTSDAAGVSLSLGASQVITDDVMDELILLVEDRYGTVNEGEFQAVMKPATWTKIKKAAKANGNSALIRVAKDKTMYGNVEIVVRSKYPEDDSTAGNVPIVLHKKSNAIIYGGVAIVKDSIEKAFVNEQSTRLVSGRGEAKLCDPYYTTFVVRIVA